MTGVAHSRRAAAVSLLLATGVLTASCAREAAPRAGVSPAPTFTRDVAPILFEHCLGCHRVGQSAPFPLTTYAEAQPRARAIADATASRRMPPWLPAHGQPPFVGERRLPDRAVQILAAWAEGGALEGDAGHLPALPAVNTAWQLGTPDLVATLPTPYRLDPGAHDVFRNLVFRLTASETRFVRALEFQAAGAPVHHAIIRVDRSRSSRARDGVDGQPGFDGMAADDVQDPDGSFLGWAPGRGPIVAPDDLPWILPRGSDLVVELHLMPASAPTDVRPSLGVFFASRAPAATPVLVVLGSKAIDIPAGAANYAIEDRFVLPVDAELRSVYPHAHYLGKTMDVQATLPDGTARQVLNIRRWSFNWQQDYQLVTPMPLPRGTTLAMRFTYDNSAANPQNRHSPPQRVTWGQNSHDEMGNVGVQLVTRTAADATRLSAAFAQHAAEIDVAGAEMLVRADPANPNHAALLGKSLARAGRLPEAVPALERALGLDRSASLENYLGGALLGLGRGADALTHFQVATTLAPRDPHLRFNLARVLSAAGRDREAVREYATAISLDPEFAEAHQELGVAYFAANRLSDALVHLRRATELAPGSATAHAAYGGALAQAGRRDEAMAELQRALQIDPGNEAARENLARLRAAPTR